MVSNEYEAHMSPGLSSLAIWYFERSDAMEIHDGIIEGRSRSHPLST